MEQREELCEFLFASLDCEDCYLRVHNHKKTTAKKVALAKNDIDQVRNKKVGGRHVYESVNRLSSRWKPKLYVSLEEACALLRCSFYCSAAPLHSYAAPRSDSEGRLVKKVAVIGKDSDWGSKIL